MAIEGNLAARRAKSTDRTALVATTANISNLASGAPLTVDGETMTAGDKVLVWEQTTASENGIYRVVTPGSGSNGAWIRDYDADSSGKLNFGTEVKVSKGTQNGRVIFFLATEDPIDVGTTNLEFIPRGVIMRSDGSPTEVLASTAIGASLAAATETSSMSVRDFSNVDWSFLVANLGTGPITEIRFRVFWSLYASPGTYSAAPEDWQPLMVDDITTGSGVSAIDEYTISAVVANIEDLASLPGSIGFTTKVSGLHMLVLVWAEAGTPTSSDFTGNALRRITP